MSATPHEQRAQRPRTAGPMVAVALTYVAVLLLAPLAGITYYGLKSGRGRSGTRSANRTSSTPSI